jgi:hypothetical protein
MIQPEVIAPPLVWLVSDAAGKVSGRRFLAVHWDTKLPPEEAAEKAGAPVAWTSIATISIRRSPPSRLTRPDSCWISFVPVEGSLAFLADYIGPHKISGRRITPTPTASSLGRRR